MRGIVVVEAEPAVGKGLSSKQLLEITRNDQIDVLKGPSAFECRPQNTRIAKQCHTMFIFFE